MNILNAPISRGDMIKALDRNKPLTQEDTRIRYGYKKYARITAMTFDAAGKLYFSCPFVPLILFGSAYRTTNNYYGMFATTDASLDKTNINLYGMCAFAAGNGPYNIASAAANVTNLGSNNYRIDGLPVALITTDTTSGILHVFG